MFPEFRGGIEVSLAKCRATAAAAIFHERHFEAERFQHFHRCNADVRFVVPHKCVVPKNDVAAVPVAALHAPRRLGRRPCGGATDALQCLQTICRSVRLRNGAASVVRRFQLFSPLRCAPP